MAEPTVASLISELSEVKGEIVRLKARERNLAAQLRQKQEEQFRQKQEEQFRQSGIGRRFLDMCKYVNNEHVRLVLARALDGDIEIIAFEQTGRGEMSFQYATFKSDADGSVQFSDNLRRCEAPLYVQYVKKRGAPAPRRAIEAY